MGRPKLNTPPSPRGDGCDESGAGDQAPLTLRTPGVGFRATLRRRRDPAPGPSCPSTPGTAAPRTHRRSAARSEERRLGHEFVSPFRSRLSRNHKTQQHPYIFIFNIITYIII